MQWNLKSGKIELIRHIDKKPINNIKNNTQKYHRKEDYYEDWIYWCR